MHISWHNLLQEEFKKQYFIELMSFLKTERQLFDIYPPKEDLWTAFDITAFQDVKVVILGQDPYFNPGQAHGLSFSVKPDIPIPPSLKNIYKELYSDVGINTDGKSGCLMNWANQGVFLLNTVMTVKAHLANSHKNRGWEIFTSKVIQLLSDKGDVVFILWGNDAKKKSVLVDKTKNKVIMSAHPSPLSAHNGFWGSRPFSKSNEWLVGKGKKEINWGL